MQAIMERWRNAAADTALLLQETDVLLRERDALRDQQLVLLHEVMTSARQFVDDVDPSIFRKG
jgi:hypothetical protein